MEYKLIGAVLIFAGCGGFGFLMASAHRKETASLLSLIHVLDYMECELQYRGTPLPELCRMAAGECSGILRQVFIGLFEALNDSFSQEVSRCMDSAISDARGLPDETRRCLVMLGNSLGRFDLHGQLRGLESVRAYCRSRYETLYENQAGRLRSYQTLGLCAGAALAILFI